MVTPVTDADFDSRVLRSEVPVLVELGAAWCPPCRMLVPVLEAVAAEREGRLRVVSLDVDSQPGTQARYGVLSLPTLLLFVDGAPVLRLVGYRPRAALLRAVDEALEGVAALPR